MGRVAPFETTPPSSVLQVCISGGDGSQGTITDSNITLVFTGPAATHFGSQAIHGVVRKPTPDTKRKRSLAPHWLCRSRVALRPGIGSGPQKTRWFSSYLCSSLHKWLTGPIPFPIGYAFAIASRT